MNESPTTQHVADRYRALAQRLTDVVTAVPSERWKSPSPCDGWTAADVLDHVSTTEAEMLARMEFGAPPAIEGLAPQQAWPIVRDAVQEALDDPERALHAYDGYFGRTTFAATIDTFYNMDLVVHGWDIAKATGLDDRTAISADEMQRIGAAVESMGDNARRAGVFGPALDVPADADEHTRFLALLGRRA